MFGYEDWVCDPENSERASDLYENPDYPVGINDYSEYDS